MYSPRTELLEIHPMKLSDVVQCFENEVALEQVTIDQYKRSASKFTAFLQRPADTTDLTVANVNAFLKWLSSQCDLGPVSVRNYRAGLLRIWNYCIYPLGIAEQYVARRIRMPAIEERPVKAWKVDQIGLLLLAAKDLAGTLISGVPACELMTTWIWLGFETGLRPSDLRRLRWEQIDLDLRLIIFTQKKTGKIHVSHFGANSLSALQSIRKFNQQFVFPVGKAGIFRWEKLLYKQASLIGFNRSSREGLGTLRKSFATQVYSEFGLAASAESLGHKSGTKVALAHYIDSESQAAKSPTQASDILANWLRNPPAKEDRKKA